MKSETRSNGDGAVKTGIPRLIVIDDSPELANFVKEVAERAGFSATALTSRRDYTRIAKTEPPDVLVLDLFMPGKDGIEIILDLGRLTDNRPFIVLISGQSRSFLKTALKLGQGRGLDVIGTLTKPFRRSDLKTILERAADLVGQKEKRAEKIRMPRSSQRINAMSRGISTDPDHASVHDARLTDSRKGNEKNEVVTFATSLQMSGDDQVSDTFDHCGPQDRAESPQIVSRVIDFPETEDSVRRAIAEINHQFCFMLWNTHLATLNALKDVTSSLTAHTADLIKNRKGTEAASSWREALRAHMKSLVHSRPIVFMIADSLRLSQTGQRAMASIDHINIIASELLTATSTNDTCQAETLSTFKRLCGENDRLSESLSALLTGVTRSLALIQERPRRSTASPARAACSALTDKPSEPPKQHPETGEK